MPQVLMDRAAIPAEAARRLAQRKLHARLRQQTDGPAWHADVRALMRQPHAEQIRFMTSSAKRKVIRAGRRGGKTVGVSLMALTLFLAGRRVLYAVPTQEQVDRFWFEVKQALAPAIDQGLVTKNETRHLVELPGTETRIRAKTAWNADTLRGDYADFLILDEYQLMAENAWGLVGAPMLLDNNGDVVFIYTPPSVLMVTQSRAKDKRHAAKLFKAAQADTSGRWATFHFTSHANPYLSTEALDDITGDMSDLAYRQEILAEDTEDVPGALWTHVLLDRTRLPTEQCPPLVYIGVALDPSATSQATSDEMGLIAGGRDANGQGYILRDASMRGTPAACARQAILLYDALDADVMIAEVNNGGEWIGTVITFVAAEMARNHERPATRVRYKMIHASRGKQTRAQPVATEYEHGRCHHIGVFPELEDEMCLVGETRICTLRGPIRLDSVTNNDWVWTRGGWRKVLWSGCTSSAAQVFEILTSSGRKLRATWSHLVYTYEQGFIMCGLLDSSVTLEVLCHESIKQFSNMVLSLCGMGNAGIETRKDIIRIAEANSYIEPYGRQHMALFPQVCSYTTKMRIPAIIPSQTWNPWTGQGIIATMPEGVLSSGLLRSAAVMPTANGNTVNLLRSSVPDVGHASILQACGPCFVPSLVAGDTIQNIVAIKTLCPVYNLRIDGIPEYYANDILVHNCGWVPGMASPNRMDAAVWLLTEVLMLMPQPAKLMELHI